MQRQREEEEIIATFAQLFASDVNLVADLLDAIAEHLDDDEDLAALARLCRATKRWCIDGNVWKKQLRQRYGFQLPTKIYGNPFWHLQTFHHLTEFAYPTLYQMWDERPYVIRCLWQFDNGKTRDVVLCMEFTTIFTALRYFSVRFYQVAEEEDVRPANHAYLASVRDLFIECLNMEAPHLDMTVNDDGGISMHFFIAITDDFEPPVNRKRLVDDPEITHCKLDMDYFGKLKAALLTAFYHLQRTGIALKSFRSGMPHFECM